MLPVKKFVATFKAIFYVTHFTFFTAGNYTTEHKVIVTWLSRFEILTAPLMKISDFWDM